MAMAEFAIAEPNSLWSTVDEKRLANVRERNDYFLRNNSYIASQYRIVKVDISKLTICEA
jgi:hypothetical protein